MLSYVIIRVPYGKFNPDFQTGNGVKGIAIFDGTDHMSIQIIAADRSKSASNSSRTPVGQAIGYFGTYTVTVATKHTTYQSQRSSFPQSAGGERIDGNSS